MGKIFGANTKISGKVGQLLYRQTRTGTVISELPVKPAIPRRSARQMDRRTQWGQPRRHLQAVRQHAAPPPFLALSALLSPLVGGCAAPPLCFSSRASFGRLRRPTPSASLRFFGGCAASLSSALSWAAGAAPSLPSLFPLYQTINNPLTPSHVMNLSVLHLTSLPLVTLKGRYRKPLAFFIFCHNCLNV